MQNHERRSHAGPPNRERLPRKRWTRPDVARPEAPTRAEVLAELPQAARLGFLAGLGEVSR